MITNQLLYQLSYTGFWAESGLRLQSTILTKSQKQAQAANPWLGASLNSSAWRSINPTRYASAYFALRFASSAVKSFLRRRSQSSPQSTQSKSGPPHHYQASGQFFKLTHYHSVGFDQF